MLLFFREPFTFDEFLNNKFSAKYFRGSWWSNTELLIKDDFGNLVTWNVVDQTCKQSHYASNTAYNFVRNSRYVLYEQRELSVYHYIIAKILVSKDTIDVVSDTAQFVSFAPGSSQYLLFKDKVESVWRHSFLAIYTILDRYFSAKLALIHDIFKCF